LNGSAARAPVFLTLLCSLLLAVISAQNVVLPGRTPAFSFSGSAPAASRWECMRQTVANYTGEGATILVTFFINRVSWMAEIPSGKL
jgi:hypothetical protein